MDLGAASRGCASGLNQGSRQRERPSRASGQCTAAKRPELPHDCKLYRRFKSVFPLQHRGRPYMTIPTRGLRVRSPTSPGPIPSCTACSHGRTKIRRPRGDGGATEHFLKNNEDVPAGATSSWLDIEARGWPHKTRAWCAKRAALAPANGHGAYLDRPLLARGRQTWCWSPWPISARRLGTSGTSVSNRRHSQLANRGQIARDGETGLHPSSAKPEALSEHQAR